MTTRTWFGGTGTWYDASLWATSDGTAGYPLPGDTAIINGGEVDLTSPDATDLPAVDGESIELGGTSAASAAEIVATAVTFGHNTTVTSAGAGAFAILDAVGAAGESGNIVANASGGSFTIQATQPDGSRPADFTLLNGGQISVSNADNLILAGTITIESGVTVAAGATITDDGIVSLFSGITDVEAGAIVQGAGTFTANADARLQFYVPVPSSITVAFGPAGRMDLGDVDAFAGTITNFLQGNTIDLVHTTATSANYDASTDLLKIDDGASPVATLKVQGPPTGPLKTSSDGNGGTLITYPGSPTRLSLEITTGAKAIGSTIVNAGMTTLGGAPIIGSGIKIGIMSDSFNATLNGVTDPADAAAQLGYLPANADGNSAVNILQDSDASGVENEGLAMAELVHQVAPGAQLYFYTAIGGQDSFASGVNALVNAGVNIIVDDWSFSNEPFFQIAGPVDTALQDAVAAGVSYFTAAGNYGNAYYQNTWQPISAALVLQNGQPAQSVSAEQFSDGTALQTVSISGGLDTTIDLQWDAAWPDAGGSVPDELGMALYTLDGTLVATSRQVMDGPDYGLIPEISLSVPETANTTQYQLAIYQIGATPVAQFKYILFGSPADIATSGATSDIDGSPQAQDPGGVIDDPLAGEGSGSVHGHQLVPGVNTVGAAYWANSPAFVAPDWTEFFSSDGPGQLLFDQAGNPLATPISDGKVDFVAPDGIQTSVPAFQGFYGTSAAAPGAAAVAALMLQADPNLTPAQITALLEESADDMGLPAADQGAGFVDAPGAVQLALNAAEAACFLLGTRIRTLRGEMPVESLAIGDDVLVIDGTSRPIRWIGTRGIDVARHPRPESVLPIRVQRGAFDRDVPHCDLFLSPDHAVFVDGGLIAIRQLVNGSSIAQVARAHVTYFHVELDRHDVLFADGLPAESYLDTGNRAGFQNSGVPVALHPDFSRPGARAAGSCAPLLVAAGRVEPAWRRLADRATAMGRPASLPASTPEPDLSLLAAARQLRPVAVTEDRHVFVVPPGTDMVTIMSRAAVPSALRPWLDDRRRLGVPVIGITRRDRAGHGDIPIDHPALKIGWHDAEQAGCRHWRWTNGAALLPLPAGTTMIEINLADGAEYPVTTAVDRRDRVAS